MNKPGSDTLPGLFHFLKFGKYLVPDLSQCLQIRHDMLYCTSIGMRMRTVVRENAEEASFYG